MRQRERGSLWTSAFIVLFCFLEGRGESEQAGLRLAYFGFLVRGPEVIGASV